MTSIILITNGSRPRLLEQTLRTLYDNTPRGEYSLTLVNDGGNPIKLKVDYDLAISLLTIDPPCHIIGRLKNLGAHWSEKQFGRGDWLYFSDDDVAFLPGWNQKMIRAAEVSEPGFQLWGGQVHPYHRPINTGTDFGLKSLGVHEYAMLDGPSWLMRWKTWNKIGPLDAKDEGACRGEDVEFCHRLTKAGGRIGVVQPHVVVHTGLTQADGKDAPGRDLREKMIPKGVLAE